MYRNRTRARAVVSIGAIVATILIMNGLYRNNADDFILSVGVIALAFSVAVNFYLLDSAQRMKRKVEGMQSLLKVRRTS